MIALLMVLALRQAPPCADSAALMTAAAERAASLDLDGAITQLASPASRRCAEAEVTYWYLRGLMAAREAYRYGGSPESLEPVRSALARLGPHTADSATAEIARIILLAASAAAQSEREEMALLLDHALQLEGRRRAAGLPGVPVVSAHEVAGDLWLQVHRFEDARLAYERAVQQVGATRRSTLGLARTAARLEDVPAACAEYRRLVAGWQVAAAEPPELFEARGFLRRPACGNPSTVPSRR